MRTGLPAGAAQRLLRALAAAAFLASGIGPALALDRDRPFHDLVRAHWGMADGLPQVSVLSIEQDQGGFVWVGTQNGIARFDGMRFEPFADGAPRGSSATMVRDVMRGRDGRIWFAHERGVLRLDGRRFEELGGEPEPRVVFALAEALDGRVLAATDDGLYVAGERGLRPVAASGQALTAMVPAPDGGLWAATTGAVLRIDGAQVRRVPLPGWERAAVSALLATPEGLWIGGDAGLAWLPAGSDLPEQRPLLDGDAVHALLRDAGGTLWIGGSAALWRVHPDGRVTRHAEPGFVRNPWVSALFEDARGNLWVGSTNEGLFRLSDGWVARIGAESGIRDPLVWSIARAPDGALALGTNSDVERLVDGRSELLVDGATLPNPTAYEIAYDPRGRLWIGTRAGLARVDAPGAAPTVVASVGDAQVNAIVPVDDDDLWIGTSDGVFRWRGGEAVRVGAPVGGPASRVRGLLPLGDDRALLATEGGVRLLADGAWTTPDWAAPLEGAFVSALDRVDDELLLVSTLDRGFGVVMQDRLRLLDRVPELASLSAWGARRVGESVVVSADEGVVVIPLADLLAAARDPAARVEWRVPVSEAGTLRGSQSSRCCNGGARSRLLVDGRRVWLPTIDGVIALNLDDLGRGAEAPLVHVLSARHAGRDLPLPDGAEPLLLDAPARDLAVSFTAIAHRDPRGLRFAYRLDGFDADWVDAGERRAAFYTNLPHGDFTFRVRAESAARIPSAQDAVLHVRVPPRWHERTGTRIVAALAFAALLALGLRLLLALRERAYAAREARMQRLIDERTAELAHANARLREANSALAQESETDPLTGLPNRRWLSAHFGDWLREGGGRPGDGTCALLVMFDLDRFKEINARLGHAAGDALLRQFGAMLERLAGGDGKVLRWGGEEFLLVVRGVPRAQAAARVAALWRAAQEHLHPAPDGTPIVLPSSVGYSTHPLAPDALELPWSVALELADAAAWRARREARNGWGGFLLADGAEPSRLAAGIEGRLDALLRGGALRWERMGSASD
jgi:diguanylate cyclase (GGDEF)-like protein